MIFAKKILPFIIIILLILVIKNNIAFILNFQNKGSGLSDLKNSLATENKKNAYLKEKLYYVKSNQFVEEEAQNKLGMLRDGEYFVIAPTPAPQDNSDNQIDLEPNWKKWLQLFL
ncbi:MAG TPA: septum formation initiator family protein [Patescibacteria group bacterium]|nr:septum formation initiator family protein [Patescibacteria group bacterium]